jgi:Major Facilitator Superfamily
MYLVNALVVIPLPNLPRLDEPRESGTAGTRRSAHEVSWWGQATAGAVTVARDPGLRRVALARMGVIFTSGAFLVIEPLYARHVLGRPPSQFALFEAAIGAGAIVTGLTLPVIRRRLPAARPAGAVLAAGAISYGLAAALFAGTPWIPIAYLGAFVWGVAGTVFYTAAATTMQRLAPAKTLGRVAGVISTAESTVENVSMPLAGMLIAGAGIRSGALILAAVAVAAGTACLRG